MGDPVMRSFMSTLELDVEDCENVFQFLDLDGEGGITFDEFIQGMKAIRGSAKRIDVATVLKLTRKIDARLNMVFPESAPKRMTKAQREEQESVEKMKRGDDMNFAL